MTNLNIVQRIRQEAAGPCRVKAGYTNGQLVAHVQTLDTDGNSIDSRTLKSEAEWTLHPLHPDFKEDPRD